ncbi:MAG: hypothetical protein ABWW69_07535 [Pyrodictiaceae archaeon]
MEEFSLNEKEIIEEYKKKLANVYNELVRGLEAERQQLLKYVEDEARRLKERILEVFKG